MKKLNSDFSIDKYGLHIRLVNEEDAEFIVRLRTNPKLGRFIHSTSNNVEKQKQWIREYKERESKGIEYYFIAIYNDKPVGVSRLYDIDLRKKTFNHGSWIFTPEAPSFCATAETITVMEIAFDVLEMKEEIMTDGVHVDNRSAVQFNKILGVRFDGQIEDVKGIYLTGRMFKEDFEKGKQRLIRFIPK